MQKNKICAGYLGPEGTFSEGVTRRYFGETADYAPLSTIEAIFDALQASQISHAVVPIENSTGGSLNQTLDCLASMADGVTVIHELLQTIRLNLLSLSGSASEVSEVQAHPQALSQAQQWLKQHFPRARQQATSSNAAAALNANKHSEVAAIAGLYAAERNGLQVVSRDIHDYAFNKTRFWVLQAASAESTQTGAATKTSFMFTAQHEAGSLVQVLKPLSEHAINMVHIESRPLRGQPWHYRFFIDTKADAAQPAMQAAMQEMKRHCSYFRLIGSYAESEYDAD